MSVDINEFVNSRLTAALTGLVCVAVLAFILGSSGRRIIKKVLVGVVTGSGVALFLYFVVGLPLSTVGIIGTIAFLIGAIFNKI
jgi:hypothetical protein